MDFHLSFFLLLSSLLLMYISKLQNFESIKLWRIVYHSNQSIQERNWVKRDRARVRERVVMEPSSSALNLLGAGEGGGNMASFSIQANALLRKNITFQVSYLLFFSSFSTCSNYIFQFYLNIISKYMSYFLVMYPNSNQFC